ncbi:hypothetical protein [Pseudomonas sp. Ant30-3]|nr:hypothetical protein [Pseudomonas sp. Ant30-3]
MSSDFFSFKKLAVLKSIRTEFAVRVLLIECLKKHALGPFNAYLNTIDFRTDEVIASEMLFDEALKYVRRDEIPNYDQGINEVFSRRYSFNPKDRIKGFDVIAFESIVMRIISAFRGVDAVQFSDRSIKSVSLEEIHAALKHRVPSVDIDNVYVTGFMGAHGERKVIQSKTLAEDIHAHLRDNEIPYYYGDRIGVYTVAYSAQEEHVHPNLTADDINILVIEIIPGFLI